MSLVDIYINLREHANFEKLKHKKELLAIIDPSTSELDYNSVMERNADKINSSFTNYLNIILNDNVIKSSKVYVIQWDLNIFLAVDYKKTYYISTIMNGDRNYFLCSCHYTKNTGIPCTHIIAACFLTKENHYYYVSDIYKLSNIYNIYSYNYVYNERPTEGCSLVNDSIKRKSKGAPETVRKKISIKGSEKGKKAIDK